MQPENQEQWQQPQQAQAGAPYQAPAPDPVPPAPAPAQPAAPSAVPLANVQAPPEQPSVAQIPSQPPAAPVNEQPAPSQTEEVSMASLDEAAPVEQVSDDDAVLLRWQASEYIQHDRTTRWYIMFGVVTLVLMALAIILIKSITFAILIPVMAAALFVYTRRQPAILDYTLTKKGLYINDKLYPYSNFKAFSVVSHAGHNTAQLVPRKRFQLGQSVYFPAEVGEPLVDMLAARLPMQQAHPDLYDRIISKLKM